MKKLTRSTAIKSYCLECSGDSSKEVMICHISDCPLWEYRSGCPTNSRYYKRRMSNALRNYANDIKALEETGIHVDFREKQPAKRPVFKKTP